MFIWFEDELVSRGTKGGSYTSYSDGMVVIGEEEAICLSTSKKLKRNDQKNKFTQEKKKPKSLNKNMKRKDREEKEQSGFLEKKSEEQGGTNSFNNIGPSSGSKVLIKVMGRRKVVALKRSRDGFSSDLGLINFSFLSNYHFDIV